MGSVGAACDVPNLFVVGGSSFVTSGARGPTAMIGLGCCPDRMLEHRLEW